MTRERDAAAASWQQDMQQDPVIHGVSDEDFTKFLDLDTDFAQFAALDDGHSGLDTPMGQLGFGQNGGLPNESQEVMHNMTMNMGSLSASHASVPFGHTVPTTQQHYETYPIYHQMQPGHNYRIPPTPVSTDMHGASYNQPMDSNGHMLYDRNQVSFTPLVSPAQTPMESPFCMPEYVLADEFFSPLTSPAMEAQQAMHLTGTTSSPVDLNADGLGLQTPSTGPKRSRRKPNSTSRPATRSVRQSPAMKPQTRRRQTSLNVLPTDPLNAIIHEGGQGQNTAPSSAQLSTLASSDDSVSPEPLSETRMRPPPIPQSASRSPNPNLLSRASSNNAPVTPATLMRMPSNQSLSAQFGDVTTQAGDRSLKEISLPDAARDLPRSLLPDIDTNDDDRSTPTLSAKSAKLSANSTPRTGALKSSNGSQESINKGIKIENKTGGRASKKRQSTSSAAISPALRPKISPSISPLVRGSGPGMPLLSAETSALYLASKSNYQNILEGTHLPGVSYPENLAENLSSKRTSHKLAEQGRRNRINLALKEIETLLPPSMMTAAKKERSNSNEADDGDKGGAAGQGTSKASTVEMAIVYIKSLQAELTETKTKLGQAEKKVFEGNTSGSQSSE